MNVIKRLTALVVSLAMCLSLAACGGAKETKKGTVAVQSVSMIMGLDIAGVNRFSGVTEAKSSQKIEKDSEKKVGEVLVEVGQEVKKGDLLFRYDVQAMKLSVEAAELEIEQLANQVNSYDTQIAELQREKEDASKKEQLSYILQIQEAQLDQSEAQYNLKQKKLTLEKLKKGTENADVCAEVDGVIQSIHDGESSFDSYSEDSDAFITIMETGTYRVKGTVSENNVSMLYEGMEVTLQSRTNPEQMWSGTISEINTGSTEETSGNDASYGENFGDTATKYSFYVTLEDSEGMMMGQHLYILPYVVDRSSGTGVTIPESYVVQEDDQAYVWAASGKDTLEKRAVTLGRYDDFMGTYLIQQGLTLEDYIADPATSLTEGQAVTKYDANSYGFSGEEVDAGTEDFEGEATENNEGFNEDFEEEELIIDEDRMVREDATTEADITVESSLMEG